MQPEPGSHRDWLDDAASDVALAASTSDQPVRWAHRCSHAQQAAAKAIKAVLISRGIDSPRTHNLGALLDLLPSEIASPPSAQEVVALSRYAAVTRYPGSYELITEAHFRDALRLAAAVVQWAEEMVGRGSFPAPQ